VKVCTYSIVILFCSTIFLLICGCDTNSGNPGANPSSEPGPVSPLDTTIYNIHNGAVPEGTAVKLTDVVVTSPAALARRGMFVEDPAGGEYSGIFVYCSDGLLFDVGESVTLTGTISEYYGLTEVFISNASDIVSAGNPGAPAPVDIANPSYIASGGPLTENCEGALVRIS
jgi:predicted extracellular nuclease